MVERSGRPRKKRGRIALVGAGMLILSFLLAGCAQSGILSGTITYSFPTDGDC